MAKLSAEQLRQYKEEGYAVVRGLIPPEEVRGVRERLMELLEEPPTWAHLQVLDPSKHRNAGGQYVPIGVQHPAEQEEVFRKVADHPSLQRAMSQILEGSVKRFTDQAIIKHKAIDGRSFYHQDSFYWHIDPQLGCNSWIALDDVDRDAIALGIVPGTHKSGVVASHEGYFDEPSWHDAATGVALKRWRIPLSQVDFSKEVVVSMAPGDAAFFANHTWHRAESNRSGATKCAYAIAYERDL